ncbi:MAG: LysR family transcriptional regulator, partial [Pseudomonadales bacterium]|nr:LysR family transcriptional regulator [Pseudomonadales bacterium]
VSATLLYAEPPWPADMQVYPLRQERIGPVLSPRYAGAACLLDQPAEVLLGEALLHTRSRPGAWRDWAERQGLDAAQLRNGQGFEHLYYLLEAALSGLGVAIAPQLLVADDIAAGRLLAPWGFVETRHQLGLWVPERQPQGPAQQLADWLGKALQQADA